MGFHYILSHTELFAHFQGKLEWKLVKLFYYKNLEQNVVFFSIMFNLKVVPAAHFKQMVVKMISHELHQHLVVLFYFKCLVS